MWEADSALACVLATTMRVSSVRSRKDAHRAPRGRKAFSLRAQASGRARGVKDSDARCAATLGDQRKMRRGETICIDHARNHQVAAASTLFFEVAAYRSPDCSVKVKDEAGPSATSTSRRWSIITPN